MNLEAITRNAENQVAVALRNKVDRFISARKNRHQLVLDILQLSDDLKTIVFRQPYEPEAKKPLKPMAPLPRVDREIKHVTQLPPQNES